jgi:hypothetical protein
VALDVEETTTKKEKKKTHFFLSRTCGCIVVGGRQEGEDPTIGDRNENNDQQQSHDFSLKE